MRRKLAWIDKQKKVHVHPKAKGERRRRLKTHEQTFVDSRAEGFSRKESIRRALDAEHRGLNTQEIKRYELGNAKLQKEISRS
jgi:hypothetical protein